MSAEKKRAKKGYEKPVEVRGHTVQVVEVEGVERLYIDGVRRAYIQAPNGFTLREAIYESPAKTLLDAGVRQAERLAAIEEASTRANEEH